MKTITLEEHFLTETYVRATAEYFAKMGMQFPEMQTKLLDLGAVLCFGILRRMLLR